MSIINRFFTGKGLQRTLLIALFLLLAAAGWFLGPWLGFGDVRPLESIAHRILTLIMLFLLLLLIWYSLPIFLHIAVIVITSVWITGPYLLIGKSYPLQDATHRLIVMAIVLLIALLWGGWRLLQAIAANPAWLETFRQKRFKKDEIQADITAINRIIQSGMKHMQRITRTIPLWRRFLFSDYRRTGLPWFMVIGAPKSGKTSIIFSSDQAFPLPEQLNRKDRENPPTGQCECLFTNDALFFDTSGKYVTRGDDLAQHEWMAILHALKKTRPVKAINGVILVLSAQDILHKDQGEQLSLASELRARLDELRQHLGIRFPVYVTVTKLDLLTGFEEYFRNLTASEREQMWGVTFPYGKEEGAVPDDLHERITQALLKLEDRLHKAMYVRQQEEYDVNDRKKMYALPQDFRVLAVNTAGIVNNIFFASRYDETQFHSTLRGIYFLSNCQPSHSELVNNSTLLHKWHNLIHQKQPQTPASVREKPNEEDVIAGSAWGKHYFLSRLFSDVIVADRDLVSYNMRLHSQYWLKNVAGHLAALAIMVWLLSAFTKSFHLNQEYLHVVKNKMDVLGSQVTEFVENPSKPLLPGVLNASRNVAQYDELNLPDPELPWRYGLYTGGTMLEGAQKLYYFFLKQSLLPQLQDEAGKKLRDAIDKNDADAVWQSLKLYLMLAGEGKTDNSYLIKEIIHQWESSGAITPYGERAVFVTHLNALFSLPEWRQNARPLNDDWVKQARALLGEYPDTMRVWHRLKSELLADSSKKLTLRGLTGGQSPMIFTLNDEVLKRQGIAHIYTRDGWQDQVKKKLITRLTGLQDEDRWVMGNAKGTTTNPLTLREGVMTLYLKEYTSVWQHFLGNIRLVPMGKTKTGGVSIDIALLRTLVGDNSPLRTLLQRVVDETTLAG